MDAPPPRTGRPPRLSREAVVDAAEAIVGREGIEALTMRRVADELSSSPMALYRHIRDKDELLVLLLDRLASDVPRPSLPAEPRERLRALFRSLYDGLDAHPWVVGVLARGDVVAPSVLGVVDDILGALLEAGLDARGAAAAYHAAWRYTVGVLTVRHAGAAGARRPPQLEAAMAAVDPGRLPHLAALAGDLAAERDRDGYDTGLAALLDGLLARG